MENYPKLDLVSEKIKLPKPREKGVFMFGKILLVGLAIVAVAGILFAYKVLSVSNDIFVQLDDQKSSLFNQIKHLVTADDKEIKSDDDGRTNILLLGMGGEGHEGSLLTDTLMVVSLKQDQEADQKDVAMISIPRDLYIETEDEYGGKINSVYAHGESKGDDQGPNEISKAVSQVIGLPIHYYVRVDFEGFEKTIDLLGGVEVEVDRGFIDRQYPTANYGWQTVEFEKGLAQMDGATALIFARSRHGVVTDPEGGSEGSDFARAARQQKIIIAAKEKAISANFVLNPAKISELLEILGDHVRTNLEPWEMIYLGELAKGIDQNRIINKVIDNTPNGMLYSTMSSAGAFILLPNVADFSEIHEFAKNIFVYNNIRSEEAKIEILNGSGVPNLARECQDRLSLNEFQIVHIGNANHSDYQKTVIYDYTNQKPKTIRILRDLFKANVSTSVPEKDTLRAGPSEEESDIIVILGQEYGQALNDEASIFPEEYPTNLDE